MEYEVAIEQRSRKVNSKVNLGPTDSKVGQILVRLLLPVLQDLLPTLSLLIEDDISSGALF